MFPVNFIGLMGKNILGFFIMIKNLVLEFIFGLRKSSILDFGKKENKMELENILKVILLNMVFGKMGKKINILKMKKNLKLL